MQTFTFNQLDERGQANTLHKYADKIWQADFANVPASVLPSAPNLPRAKAIHAQVAFVADSWRFTIHGERVA